MKKVLIIIAALIALIVLIGLIAPKEYSIEREVMINRPKSEVFEYLLSLEAQNQWSVWGQADPDMKTEFRGEDCTVGFVSAWEGNEDVGRGEQEITGITPQERIDFELRFIEPWESKSIAWLLTQEISENETRVTWGFNGRMGFPLNLMMLAMNMDKAIGGDLEQGLHNLKEMLELDVPSEEFIVEQTEMN